MERELTNKEINVLMMALDSYVGDIQKKVQEHKELIYHRQQVQGCCQSADLEPELPYYYDTVFIRRLFKKLKQSLMLLPMECHNPDRQYGYGERFGYQKMTWDKNGIPDSPFRFPK